MFSVDNYDIKEEDLIVKAAIVRKEMALQRQKEQENVYKIRKRVIEGYFLRLSNEHKTSFIMRLLDNVNGFGTLHYIIEIINVSRAKVQMYEFVEASNLIYDKLIIDHDRMLDKNCLVTAMKDDEIWFRTLRDEQQMFMIEDLVRMSGGVVKRKLIMPLFRKYSQMLRELREEEAPFNPPLVVKLAVSNEDVEEPCDTTLSASVEVERQRKKWNEMMAKYKAEVEQLQKKLGHVREKKTEQKEKPKKAPKKKKKPTEKKSKKSKGSSKRKESETADEIDIIQLLPIWIVKKIFGYLDKNTLTKIKKVNKFWAYAVGDLLTDIKARGKINKALDNMKAQIDPARLEAAVKDFEEKKVHPTKTHKYAEQGAVSIDLVPKPKGNMDVSVKSVLADVLTLGRDLGSGLFVPFPRLIDPDIALQRHHPCFLKDVNVRLGVHEDIERQKSFLTYSLSSIVSSMVIGEMDPAKLADW